MLAILEIASSVEAVQDGRIHIEKINDPFLFREKARRPNTRSGLDLAIARGWLVLHESGTFVRFTQAGADLFAWFRIFTDVAYLPGMRKSPFDPCIPTRRTVPGGKDWIHEIKHDGYRLITRRQARAAVHPQQPRLFRSVSADHRGRAP